MNKKMSKFFKSESERNLWIKLCAENQIAWEKSLTWFDSVSQTHKPTLQAQNPRTMEQALEIANRQLECDEKKGVLRTTLEDYLLKSTAELDADRRKAHTEFCEKHFKS